MATDGRRRPIGKRGVGGGGPSQRRREGEWAARFCQRLSASIRPGMSNEDDAAGAETIGAPTSWSILIGCISRLAPMMALMTE